MHRNSSEIIKIPSFLVRKIHLSWDKGKYLEPLNKRIRGKDPQGCLSGKGNWKPYAKVRVDCKTDVSIRLLL